MNVRLNIDVYDGLIIWILLSSILGNFGVVRGVGVVCFDIFSDKIYRRFILLNFKHFL